ncbi:fumarate reductase [Campylobacterota bacterium]|nr:fumarate reductase [Campylobacterota bacterium]
MSVLVIGGDRVDSVKEALQSRGFFDITHWDMRKARDCDRKLPECADCVVMLTDFLSHNAMNHFKREAKKTGVPIVCAKRGSASVSCALEKMFAQSDRGEKQCPMITAQQHGNGARTR